MYFINNYIPYPSVVANIFIFYLISKANFDVWQRYMKTGKIECEQYSSKLLAYLTCGWACFTVVLGVPIPYIYNHFYQFFTFTTWFAIHNYQKQQKSTVILHLICLSIFTAILLQTPHFQVGVLSSVMNIIFVIRSFITFKNQIEDGKNKSKLSFSRFNGYLNMAGFFFAAIQNIEGDVLHFPFLSGCIQFGIVVAQEFLVDKQKLYSDQKQLNADKKSKKE